MLTDADILRFATEAGDMGIDTDTSLIRFARAVERAVRAERDPPSVAELRCAHAEGEAARREHRTFKKHGAICPYTFDQFPGMTPDEFTVRKRPLLDAWFDGYVDRGSPIRAQPTPDPT